MGKNKTLKSIKEVETKELLNFKATSPEILKIKAKAKKFAKGNTSAWIRFASMNFTPSDKDLA